MYKMYKSIIYKEWIKTQKVIGLMAAIFAAAGIYSFMKILEGIRLSGMVNTWESVIQKDVALLPYFEYLPLLAGLSIAILQYVPELQYKRLKLTLHLPLNETKILIAMLAYGTSIVVLLMLITMGLLLGGLSLYFAPEMVFATLFRILPWFLCAPAAYLVASWICLEPQWKQRIFNAVPGICAISFFFLKAKSGAYCTFDLYLLGFTIAAFFFSFSSVARFKMGKM